MIPTRKRNPNECFLLQEVKQSHTSYLGNEKGLTIFSSELSLSFFFLMNVLGVANMVISAVMVQFYMCLICQLMETTDNVIVKGIAWLDLLCYAFSL